MPTFGKINLSDDMAEINSTLGDIRGKVGNVILYEGRDGKTLARGWWKFRKPSEEPQKRRSAAFGTLAKLKSRVKPIIDVGFPGNGKLLKGCNAFVSANSAGVISVEKAKPSKKLNKRKTATQEFKSKIDFSKLRVAAGPLVPPTAEARIDMKKKEVHFSYRATQVNAADCFLDDRIHGAFVDEEKWYGVTGEICRRGEDGEISIRIPEVMEAKRLALYVFATSADGTYASDSVCLHVPAEK